MKVCAKCGAPGPFLANASHKDGLMGSCRKCEAARRRVYYAANAERERRRKTPHPSVIERLT